MLISLIGQSWSRGYKPFHAQLHRALMETKMLKNKDLPCFEYQIDAACILLIYVIRPTFVDIFATFLL